MTSVQYLGEPFKSAVCHFSEDLLTANWKSEKKCFIHTLSYQKRDDVILVLCQPL